jgi:hypothetical protein
MHRRPRHSSECAGRHTARARPTEVIARVLTPRSRVGRRRAGLFSCRARAPLRARIGRKPALPARAPVGGAAERAPATDDNQRSATGDRLPDRPAGPGRAQLRIGRRSRSHSSGDRPPSERVLCHDLDRQFARLAYALVSDQAQLSAGGVLLPDEQADARTDREGATAWRVRYPTRRVVQGRIRRVPLPDSDCRIVAKPELLFRDRGQT